MDRNWFFGLVVGKHGEQEMMGCFARLKCVAKVPEVVSPVNGADYRDCVAGGWSDYDMMMLDLR